MGKTSSGAYYDNNNVVQSFQLLQAYGYTMEQSAGIIGNWVAESGVTPGAVQSDGPGRGVEQWSVGERWQELQNWAASKKLNPALLNTQIAFAVHELNTTEKKGGAAVKAAKTPQEAAAAFLVKVERPSNQSAENQAVRGGYANDVLKYYLSTETGKAAARQRSVPLLSGAGISSALKNPGNFAGSLADATGEDAQSIGGSITDAAGGVVNAATGSAKVLSDLGGITKHFGDPSFWVRMLFILVGVGLLFVAASKLADSSMTSNTPQPSVAPKTRPVPVPV